MEITSFGQLIAERRKELGVTQRTLAESLCVSNKAVSKWECNRGLPDVSLIVPLAKSLDLSADELLLWYQSGQAVRTVSMNRSGRNEEGVITDTGESVSPVVTDSVMESRLDEATGSSWRDYIAPFILALAIYPSLANRPYNLAGLVLGARWRPLFLIALVASSYGGFATHHFELLRRTKPALYLLRISLLPLLSLIISGLPILAVNLKVPEIPLACLVGTYYLAWLLFLFSCTAAHSERASIGRRYLNKSR